jgi:hypothetical protein
MSSASRFLDKGETISAVGRIRAKPVIRHFHDVGRETRPHPEHVWPCMYPEFTLSSATPAGLRWR